MLGEADRDTASLRQYLRVLRRRKLALILSMAVVAIAALVSSLLQEPIYASTAEVLRQTKSQSIFGNAGAPYVDPQRALQTEIRVLQSQAVRSAAREKLGYPAGVMASPVAQTDVISVRAEDRSPQRAADIANAYARAYIEHRRAEAVDSVLSQVTEVGKKIADLQGQIDGASGVTKDNLVAQQALFKNRLDQLQVDASVQTGGAELVNSAVVSTVPVRPQPVRNLILALVLGSFFGVGVVFLLEYLDDSVKTKEDFERAAVSLPVLSMIPAAPGGWKANNRLEPNVVSISEPSSPMAESYRTLRTAIQFLGVDRPVRALQVTSANAEEGKTTTLANLGVALARAGARVVMVCSDLRRPKLHEYFGLSNAVGLTSVLLGDVPLAQALQRVPGVDRLYLLASGPLPPNPSELLQSNRTADILNHLKAEGNFLLVDSPPILPVTDGLVVSQRVDGTVFVCAAGRTGRKELTRAIEMLRQVDAPLIGAVMNGVTSDSSYGYAYEYYRTDVAVNGNGSVANGKGPAKRSRRRGASKSKSKTKTR